MLGKHWLVNGVTGENKEQNASSCAGLGLSIGIRRPVIAATRGRRRISRLSLCHLACGRLEIRGLQSGVFRDSSEHPRSDHI